MSGFNCDPPEGDNTICGKVKIQSLQIYDVQTKKLKKEFFPWNDLIEGPTWKDNRFLKFYHTAGGAVTDNQQYDADRNEEVTEANLRFGRYGACAQPMEKFCSTIEPGEGRRRECLFSHESELSQACKDMYTSD